MSVPRRHHYLPQFFLERWVNDAGNLFEYSRPHRELVVRERTPSATGYKTGLYSIEGRQDPRSREEVEIEFMQRLDDAAALAITQLEQQRKKPRDAKVVTDWSRFVMSLVYRNPARVEDLRGRVQNLDHDPNIQTVYSEVRSNADPVTYEEFIGSEGASANEEAQAYLIRRVIDSKFIGQQLNNMLWHIGDIPIHCRDLVLSDSPVVTSNGVGLSNGFLILPMGPRTFFLAVNTAHVRDFFVAENEAGRLARNINNAVVRNAEVLVVASSKSHKLFVEQRLVSAGQPVRDRVTWEI